MINLPLELLIWAAENSSHDPRKKLSHDIKSCHVISVKCVNGHGIQQERGKRGKGLSEELKGQIIDKILETGGVIFFQIT